jgi:hypothetical protein
MVRSHDVNMTMDHIVYNLSIFLKVNILLARDCVLGPFKDICESIFQNLGDSIKLYSLKHKNTLQKMIRGIRSPKGNMVANYI